MIWYQVNTLFRHTGWTSPVSVIYVLYVPGIYEKGLGVPFSEERQKMHLIVYQVCYECDGVGLAGLHEKLMMRCITPAHLRQLLILYQVVVSGWVGAVSVLPRVCFACTTLPPLRSTTVYIIVFFTFRVRVIWTDVYLVYTTAAMLYHCCLQQFQVRTMYKYYNTINMSTTYVYIWCIIRLHIMMFLCIIYTRYWRTQLSTRSLFFFSN